MHEIDYKTLSIVIESWEKLRRLDNYEEKAGVVLFRKCVHKQALGRRGCPLLFVESSTHQLF